MFLAPNCYAMGKNVIVQSVGQSENWLRHLNRIVKRERSDCIDGCIINRRKSLSEFRASTNFDSGNKHFQNAVVQLQLISGIMPGI